MKTYAWRKNFTSLFADHEKITRGKLAFKTKALDWIGTASPVVALISIHSTFHEEIGGDLKMEAFISTIKSHVKGKVTVLLTDRAHTHTLSLKHQGDFNRAFQECLGDSQALLNRYQTYFKGCHVAYWHSYICQDKSYAPSMRYVRCLVETDPIFKDLLYQDTEETYTKEREVDIPNKALFIEKAKEDLIEQCTCLLVIANKGYRFQFYPGSSCLCTDYISRVITSAHPPISWIHVFLSIEKKTVTPLLDLSK